MTGSQEELIEHLRQSRQLPSDAVAAYMARVDRAHFAPRDCPAPYEDHPVCIGHGATMSAPSVHAVSLGLLEQHLKPGSTVLDIGSGSGYLCAVMGLMVGDKGGHVYGVDHIPELVETSISSISEHFPDLIRGETVQIMVGDGHKGLPQHAPYDCIHLGAAVEDVPEDILGQLKPGGRLVGAIGAGPQQSLVTVDKNQDGSVNMAVIDGVQFVPMTSVEAQLETTMCD
ncbi:Protein-L-isoaspartate O-methyltransferase [Plasmodiophora brassicae]|uniref:Protein-L-isoaspartate O-methyltransferase n=1 Tax=Plasmodiophora brassicae TaxID=37360 RepID=A0A0G4J2J3_PLABS|nr:hypothetical protein PBRA_008707 [Plasmodiophora brassicae]SPR01486.1 unnamed protein product [Plasmodiophora brassicae]